MHRYSPVLDDRSRARSGCRRARPASGRRRHRGGVGPGRTWADRGLRARRGHAHAGLAGGRPGARRGRTRLEPARRPDVGNDPPAVCGRPELGVPHARARRHAHDRRAAVLRFTARRNGRPRRGCRRGRGGFGALRARRRVGRAPTEPRHRVRSALRRGGSRVRAGRERRRRDDRSARHADATAARSLPRRRRTRHTRPVRRSVVS